MINDYYSLSLISNICKNNYHKILTSYWKSQGFDSCKCEFQIKVLGSVESLPNTIKPLHKRSKDYDY
jgi:hypothetical protein